MGEEAVGKKECPLCQRNDADILEEQEELERERWRCGSCGRFEIWKRRLLPMQEEAHVLRGLATERRVRDQSALVIRPDNNKDLVAQAPHHPVEQAQRLLVNLAYRSSEPTLGTSLSTSEARAFAFARHKAAVERWLDFLQHEGLLEYERVSEVEPNDLSFHLTLEGWRRVRELRNEGIDSDLGFVAMGFDDAYDALWAEGIKPAVEAAGWTPVRADKEEHTDRIDDWILNKIDEAAFVVADTTENNPGVCFEAGYARGRGIPVIWVTREDMTNSGASEDSSGDDADGEEDQTLHFDLRQYNHLRWTEGEEGDLAGALEQRIRHRVGAGGRAGEARSPFVA